MTSFSPTKIWDFLSKSVFGYFKTKKKVSMATKFEEGGGLRPYLRTRDKSGIEQRRLQVSVAETV